MQVQEEAADERALQWLRESSLPGETPPDELYLEALLTAARAASASPSPRQFGALALVETPIKKRIMKICHSSRSTSRPVLTIAIAALLFSGAILRPTRAGETASSSETDPAKSEAVAAMQAWLALIDAGEYAKSWDQSSAFFKANVKRDFWVSSLKSVRSPLGKLEERQLASALHQQSIPQQDGTMKKVDAVIAQFDTSFHNLDAARETVTFEREKDGSWRASGYYIKPM